MIQLPTTKTEPVLDSRRLRLLIYGPPKIGKSTFCAGMPDAVFAATEPGLDSLSVYQVPISTWEEFLDFAKQIAAGQHSFKTIIIDTIDRLYRYCETHVCNTLNISIPEDQGYGVGRGKVNAEFFRVLDKLTSLPYGVVFTAHAVTKEVSTPAGKTDRTVPTLPDKVSQYLTAMVSVIGFASVRPVMQPDGTTRRERVLSTKPHTDFDAGDRTGRLPETLPLSWQAFADAMNATVKAPAKTPATTSVAGQTQAQRAATTGGAK
jgi:hypothetical protein